MGHQLVYPRAGEKKYATFCYFFLFFLGSLTEKCYFCDQVLLRPRSFRGWHYITNIIQ